MAKISNDFLSFLYPNSICFNDKSKVKLTSSVFYNEFSNMYISIDHCNNKTYSGTCKPPEQIDEFLFESTIFAGT